MSARPVVLVTGAAQRLGRVIALELARRGHDIALHFHHSADAAVATLAELRDLGASAHAFPADLADEAATAALVPAVLERFGRLDGVVHSASRFVYDDVATFSYAALSAHACVNTGSAVLLARALHAHAMSHSTRAALVLMLDQRLWNPNPDYLSYALSKSGLEMLTRVLAKALAPKLRVVGVAPGLASDSELIDDARLKRMAALSLTGATVQPAEIADAVAFALGNAAMTGSTLMVDAGYHLQPMARDFPFL
jgi:NAD(P)-dependent dehydrogenase (short-subunit alcohol dehydrogenase family)